MSFAPTAPRSRAQGLARALRPRAPGRASTARAKQRAGRRLLRADTCGIAMFQAAGSLARRLALTARWLCVGIGMVTCASAVRAQPMGEVVVVPFGVPQLA